MRPFAIELFYVRPCGCVRHTLLLLGACSKLHNCQECAGLSCVIREGHAGLFEFSVHGVCEACWGIRSCCRTHAAGFLRERGTRVCAVRRQVVRLVEAKKVVTFRFWCTRILPVGLFMALTLHFGNLVYLYLTVAFIQMLKVSRSQSVGTSRHVLL